jgi:hypothetical protein
MTVICGRRWLVAWVAGSALAAGFVWPGSTPTAADTYLEVEYRAAPGPHGPITVIGDSVLLGSALWGPTLVDRLAERGWGPIQFRAGVGYQTGAFGTKTAVQASYWIKTWRAQGWDPKHVVVNLGNNDSLNCQTVQCARDVIMFLVDVIGDGHVVWWPKVSGLTNYQVRWNQALDLVAGERPGTFFTWDWPAVLASGGFRTYDFVHLDPNGYRKRSQLMAREITADFAVSVRSGVDVAIPDAIGVPAEFVPLVPARVLDTRDGGAAAIPAGGHVEIDLTPHVPPGTSAVAIGLTTDRTTAAGVLTGYPCDRQRREVSNVNHAAGVPRAALAVVPLSADGHLCVFTAAQGHVIVDLQGAFVTDPAPGTGSRFTPIDPPERLLDTRDTGRAGVVEVTVPAGATAVAVNLTATNVSAAGWLKAYPCGSTPPPVSNVNYLPGDTVASAAFVPVSDAGTICVQSLMPADVVVDITGTFAAGGQLRFVPTTPTRLLDTRSGVGGWSPIHATSATLDILAAPDGAKAVTGTLTIVEPLRAAWLKAYPCGAVPPTSSVNAPADAVFANAATVGVSQTGRMCILALNATHTLFDITGWWTT